MQYNTSSMACEFLTNETVVATLALKDDPQLSAMLKHIVLSFKKLSP